MGICKYIYFLIENYLLNPKIDVCICANDGKVATLNFLNGRHRKDIFDNKWATKSTKVA